MGILVDRPKFNLSLIVATMHVKTKEPHDLVLNVFIGH